MRSMIRFLTLVAVVIILAAPAYATQKVVYPFGTEEVSVPIDQYINVFCAGDNSARVYKSTGGPSTNTPKRFTLETSGTVTNKETVFGPYTSATTIKIQAGADPVFYSVGALAASLVVLRNSPRISYNQVAPVAYNSALTLLTSDLMGGLITSTQATGATIALTLPTGTLADAAAGLEIGMGFEWSLLNLSAAAADTVTLTAGTGHTIVGPPIVQSVHATTGGITGATARWLTKKTAANTFITYRIGN